MHDVAHVERLRWLTKFLIPPTASRREQDLSAFVMNVPKITAARFKRHICYDQPRLVEQRQVACPREVIGIRFVLCPEIKNATTVKYSCF